MDFFTLRTRLWFWVGFLGGVLGLDPTQVGAAVLSRGPYLLNQYTNGITVRWRTDHSVRHSSVVRYGSSPNKLDRVVAAQELPVHYPGYQEWEAVIGGLESGSLYYYALEADEALVTGADHHHWFKTAEVNPQLLRFWLLGDSGSNRPRDASLEAVLERRNVNDAVRVRNGFRTFNGQRKLDGLILLGDNAYPLGTDEHYQAALFNLYGDELRHTPLWPCVGNHDLDTAYQYVFFTQDPTPDDGLLLGRRYYYSFDQGNAHFVVLDPWKTWWENNTNPKHLPWQVQKEWLVADLTERSRHWNIVICHFPLYCDGNYDSDTNEPLALLRQELVPLFDQFGVDLVLTGHDHTYQRTYLIRGHTGERNTFDPRRHMRSLLDGTKAPIVKQHGPDSGTVYVVSGTGGGSRPDGPFAHPAMVRLGSEQKSTRGAGVPGSLLLEIQAEILRCVQVGAEGDLIDQFRLQKLKPNP